MYPLEIQKHGIELTEKYDELSGVIPKYFGKLSIEMILSSKCLGIAKFSNKLYDCTLTLGERED